MLVLAELTLKFASPLKVVSEARKPDLGRLLNGKQVGFALDAKLLVDELLTAEELS